MWNCMKILGSWFWAYVPLRTPLWPCCLGINSTYARYFGLCLLNFLRSDVAAHLIDSLHCFGAHIGPLIWVHVHVFLAGYTITSPRDQRHFMYYSGRHSITNFQELLGSYWSLIHQASTPWSIYQPPGKLRFDQNLPLRKQLA